ncbi:hypothetical protein M758_1G115000 [Ceratodon purpureus]|nr:hypothetical protein M758_1G115000 [Ceratodon purpureus]
MESSVVNRLFLRVDAELLPASVVSPSLRSLQFTCIVYRAWHKLATSHQTC